MFPLQKGFPGLTIRLIVGLTNWQSDRLAGRQTDGLTYKLGKEIYRRFLTLTSLILKIFFCQNVVIL